MRRIFLSILFFSVCLLKIQAQDKRFEYADTSLGEHATGEEKDILSDTLIYITNVYIPPDSVQSWKNNKRFAYMKTIDSLLKDKQRKELDEFNKSAKTKPSNFLAKLFSSGILQILFWSVAIIFVVFILYKLFLSNGVFSRNTVSTSKVNELSTEELIATVSDYDKLISQSIKLGDYRMAVRYLFLKTLSNLANKEYLQYSSDKTNYQYVQEMRADKKNEFASLVLNYEYIWYGNFALGAETYTGIEKKFSSFNQSIP